MATAVQQGKPNVVLMFGVNPAEKDVERIASAAATSSSSDWTATPSPTRARRSLRMLLPAARRCGD